jgi:hypothetical protein
LWCKGFSGRKLKDTTLAVVMLAGVITLLGAPLWLPFPLHLWVKTLDRLGLDNGGVFRRYPLGGRCREALISFSLVPL